MLALTVVYTCLFFYIRMQAKQFPKTISTSENHPTPELGDVSPTKDSPLSTTKTAASTIASATQAGANGGNTLRQRVNRVSLALLLYPAIYVILELPIAVARISEFAGKDFSLRAVYVGGCLFSLQGFAQVILYSTTRKGIISWDWVCRKCKCSTSTKPRSFDSHNLELCDPPTSSKIVIPDHSALSIERDPPPLQRSLSTNGPRSCWWSPRKIRRAFKCGKRARCQYVYLLQS
jgi:hypothetical protein